MARVPYVKVDTKGCVLGEDVASGNLLLQRPELKRGVAQPKPHTCAPSARRSCCQQTSCSYLRPARAAARESRRCFANGKGQLKPNQRW